jgi:hypothetical protein
VLFLREHERMPYAEIALVLGVDPVAAARLAWRAREALSAPYGWREVAAVYRHRLGIVRAPGSARLALRVARAHSNMR